MESFAKACAGALICAVLMLTLEKQGKEMALLLSLAACCMMGLLACSCLEEILGFLREMGQIAALGQTWASDLTRIAGIGAMAQLAASLCADAGSTSLGKSILMLGHCVMLVKTLPIMRNLLTVIRDLLGVL